MGKYLSYGETVITPITEFKAHKKELTSIAFSPDGKTLATADIDTVYLWNVKTGEKIGKLSKTKIFSTPEIADFVYSIAFSPDGKILAIGSDSGIYLCDVKTGEKIGKLGKDYTSKVNIVFSPNSKILASNEFVSIKLWDVEKKKLIKLFEDKDTYKDKGKLLIYSNEIFSPNSNFFAFLKGVGREDGEFEGFVNIFDIRKKEIILTLNFLANCMKFSSEEKLFIMGNGNVPAKDEECCEKIIAYDLNNKEVSNILQGKLGRFPCISFSFYLRNILDGKLERCPCIFSHNERFLFSVEENRVNIWDIEKKVKVDTLGGDIDYVNNILLSPNEKLLLTSGDVSLQNGKKDIINIWDIEKKEKVAMLETPADFIAFSPDGKILASGTRDGVIKLWAIEEK